MFGNLLALRRAQLGDGLNLGGLKRLQAALADLPPPWRVLRNRRPGSEQGPPWVKFLAFHPEKGIALIDMPPADPEAAIDPLDAFLARTGLDAFTRGDPPIIALAVGGDESEELAKRLDAAFAAQAPCGIHNTDWTDAVIELLLSTPALLLSPLTKAAARPAPVAPPQPEQEPPPRQSPVAPATKPGPTTITAWATRADAKVAAIASPPSASAAALAARPLVAAKPDEPKLPALSEPLEPTNYTAIWLVSGAVAASLVFGAISLVYQDWPHPRPIALAEAEADTPAPPQPAPQPTIVMPLPAQDAAMPAADPAPPRRVASAPVTVPAVAPHRRIVYASRPIWEEPHHAEMRVASARRHTPKHEIRSPADLLTAFNDWLTVHRF